MRTKTILIAVASIAIIGLMMSQLGQTKVVDNENTEDVKSLIAQYSSELTQTTDMAYVDANYLTVVKEDKSEVKYELPKDEFYVSLAPYYNGTHPCKIHYLTSCFSELGNQTFNVTVTAEDGTVVLDEEMKSQANGFIDLWLPRNETYEVKIKHETSSVKTTISTFEGDNTCITTPLQLQ